MPPSLLFIESNTTGTGMIALERSRNFGFQPILVTSRPDRYRGLSDTGAEVLVLDTNDVAELALKLNLGDVHGITTTSEYYLVTVAQLAQKLGLPGNCPEATRIARDKAAARTALAGAGIPQPRFATVASMQQLRPAVEVVGLPCVVKPVDESGSFAVRRCDTESDVRQQVERILALQRNVRGQPSAGVALIEEYLSGPEFSVETFLMDSKPHHVGVTAKSVGCRPWFVETGHIFPAILDDGCSEAVNDLVSRCLAALGLSHGPVHTEVRLTSAGPQIIEVNARLAGGMIPELVRLATGVDLLEQQLNATTGLPVRLDPTVTAHAGVEFLLAPSDGVLMGLCGVDRARDLPGVERVTVTTPPGSRVRSAEDAYHRLGHVIASGSTHRTVRERLDRAVQEIDIIVDKGVTAT